MYHGICGAESRFLGVSREWTFLIFGTKTARFSCLSEETRKITQKMAQIP